MIKERNHLPGREGLFIMRQLRIITIVISFLLVPAVYAELPGQGPRLGQDRIEQAAIESGSLSLKQIRRAGLKATPWTGNL